MKRSAALSLVVALLVATAGAARAEPKSFDSVGALLAAVRAKTVKEGARVIVKRATVTTQPVTNDHGGAHEYQMWFYVNDKGRDGDGILVSLQTYYGSGSDPFDPDSEDPYESDIEVPKLERGYEMTVSGRITRRLDKSAGWQLERGESDLEFDETTRTIRHDGVKVLSKVAAPAPAVPSDVTVAPSEGLRVGDRLVVTGRNLGDRAKLLFDDKAVEIVERRPGLLIGRVPTGAIPGAHRVALQNPESGKSGEVKVKVVGPVEPGAPEITGAVKSGGFIVIKGKNLSGATKAVVKLGDAVLGDMVDATANLIIVSAPATVTGDLSVTVGTKTSNKVTVKTVGILGALPGF